MTLLLGSLVVSAALAADAPRVNPQDVAEAKSILAAADFTGGLIVHLGCGDGRLTAALYSGGGAVVHGLTSDRAKMIEARRNIGDVCLYGKVSVDTFDGEHLPYVDNLVNLVVVNSLGGQVTGEEIARVLVPNGVAMIRNPLAISHVPFGIAASCDPKGWTQLSKPWPDEIDQWTHFLHNAGGNAVSSDRRVGPPRHLQWDGGPKWSRSHETDMSMTAAVTAGGRLFHTVDEGPIGIHETPKDQRQLPDKCFLVARDAFNGIELWRRPIPDWGSAAWDAHRWKWGKGDQLWSAPLTLPRRLVATRNRVYMTLGFRACVSEIDAVTGKRLREFPETKAAEEIVLSRNVLVARVRDVSESTAGGESIVAIDIETGNAIWRQGVEAVADLTLAIADGRVCFYDTGRLMAVDLRTGKRLWQSEDSPRPKRPITAGTLVMDKDVVLFAGAGRVETRSSVDGKLLWSTKTNSSFRGMPDVFVTGGLAWVGTLTTTGLDLLTGEVTRQINPGHLYTDGHHVRCHRGKATEKYLLWSKRGVEFLDLKSDGHMRHDWVRGTCRYGILPANGLLYAPPHPCFCYPGVKLAGFNALAAAGNMKDEGRRMKDVERLEKGPAFGEVRAKRLEVRGQESGVRNQESGRGKDDAEESSDAPTSDFRLPHSNDWPTYRHDIARSGCAGTQVPSRLKRAWQVALGGKVSPPVVVGDRVFVAEVDAHRVTCLDAQSGTRLWSYTAGGPVDSPPTIHRERVVFGCTDGSVSCLTADDGQLVWRFRAAPANRRIVSYGRLESAWPVHGSVLVEKDTAFFAAGRSSYLDGGIFLYGLDVATGEVRCRARLDGPAPDLSVPCNRAHEMDGSNNDILVGNGQKLFLTQNVFDLKLNQLDAPMTAQWGARKTDRHLVATGGFLDDSGFDRLYWMYAERWPGLYVAVGASKAGQILAFDDTTTYGLHTFTRKFSRSPYFAPATEGHELFAEDNANEPVLPANAARRERGSMSRTGEPKWSIKIPVRARAMVLTRDVLFLAGPPDIIDSDDPHRAFEGRQGGLLWAVSTANGRKIAEYQLDTPPAFDGLIAARKKLFVTTTDGRISCWE